MKRLRFLLFVLIIVLTLGACAKKDNACENDTANTDTAESETQTETTNKYEPETPKPGILIKLNDTESLQAYKLSDSYCDYYHDAYFEYLMSDRNNVDYSYYLVSLDGCDNPILIISLNDDMGYRIVLYYENHIVYTVKTNNNTVIDTIIDSATEYDFLGAIELVGDYACYPRPTFYDADNDGELEVLAYKYGQETGYLAILDFDRNVSDAVISIDSSLANLPDEEFKVIMSGYDDVIFNSFIDTDEDNYMKVPIVIYGKAHLRPGFFAYEDVLTINYNLVKEEDSYSLEYRDYNYYRATIPYVVYYCDNDDIPDYYYFEYLVGVRSETDSFWIKYNNGVYSFAKEDEVGDNYLKVDYDFWYLDEISDIIDECYEGL